MGSEFSRRPRKEPIKAWPWANSRQMMLPHSGFLGTWRTSTLSRKRGGDSAMACLDSAIGSWQRAFPSPSSFAHPLLEGRADCSLAGEHAISCDCGCRCRRRARSEAVAAGSGPCFVSVSLSSLAAFTPNPRAARLRHHCPPGSYSSDSRFLLA